MPSPAAGSPPPLRRVIIASFVGTTIEWYDFFLYGTSAALIFGPLFFPTVDPVVGTLSAYGTFAVGFVARPLGGVVFGHYGDRVGRKRMLVYSLLLMGIATLLVGLVPSYQSIGIGAPIALVLLRFVQGIGVGGEWGGAVLMALEHSGGPRRGFHASWPQMGAPAGSLLSTAMFALFSTALTDRQFLSWGWRVPFLLSGLLIGVGLFIRLRVLETPAFERLREQKAEAKAPLVEVLRSHPRELLLGLAMRIGQAVIYYIYSVFILSYGQTLGYDRNTLLTGVAIIGFVGLFTIPLWAHVSDRFGRRAVYLAGALVSLLYALPFFWLVGLGSTMAVWIALIIGMNVGHDLLYGPQAAYFSELFTARVRYSGASIVYQLASIAGGLAPLIATVLLARYGASAVAGFIALSCLVTLVATWLAPETHRQPLD